ncbi:hypothetical protein [Halomontanus rarus]|uniref:hypothetical protein n=1 Tax=Halomontanus rarus TaxID=3034020 RepID=UPI001A985C41
MASQSATATGGTVSRRSSIAASAGLGVLAAAIGYLTSYVLIAGEVRDTFGGDVAEWKGVAWYVYNAHMVDIETSSSFGSIGGSDTVNLIAESSSTSATALYVIPPLVLLGTGAMLAIRFDAADIGEAVAVGAPVTIGYAVVVGLGALVAESSGEGAIFGIEISGSAAPALGPAVVLAGVLYPLVFATAGAVLAAVLDGR